MNAIIPLPPCAVSVRPAVLSDLSFIDSLQRKHTKMVGWMPTQQLEGKIKAGHVLVAQSGETTDSTDITDGIHSSVPSVTSVVQPLGYCIGNDQYFKRDDVGVIYQMNVVPGKQRGLIGATLLKAMFERAAYGCKLFCCWCAQDIEANHFWESMGFVALAFRTGSRTRGANGAPRIHIFWQRRIRAGDETTPYWFPSQTGSGSIREDRLVLPIPPGTHWRDAKPIVLPGAEDRQLEDETAKEKRARAPRVRVAVVEKTILAGGLRFAPLPTATPVVAPVACPELSRREKPKRQKAKNDPKLVAAARELRDRWLEHANAHPEALISRGKYDVARLLAEPTAEAGAAPLLIESAIAA